MTRSFRLSPPIPNPIVITPRKKYQQENQPPDGKELVLGHPESLTR